MKKILYGTTALAAIGLLAGGAHAADKMGGPIQVSIGGYFYGFLQGVSQKDGAGEPGQNHRSFAITDKSRIQFSGKANLDNGLQAGFVVQLRGNSTTTEVPNQNTTDQIDDHHVYLSSATYGRLELGATAGAARKMFYGPATPLQPAAGLNSPNFQWMVGNSVGQPVTLLDFGIADKANKIQYFTPRVAGFQLGVSYAPDNCTQNEAIALGNGNNPTTGWGGNAGQGAFYNSCIFNGPTPTNNNVGQQSQIVIGAVNYVGKFNGVDVGAYIGGDHGKLEAQATNGWNLRDKSQYGGGFRIGYMGWMFGASARYDNDGVRNGGPAALAPSGRWDANVGVAYHTGPWGIGATYAYAAEKYKSSVGTLANDGNKDKLNAEALGVSYALGPGISLVGGVEHMDFKDHTNVKNNGFLYTAGTVLNF